MNPPLEQGPSGTCYAHATASAADGVYNIFTQNTSSSKADFSQAFIAFCGRFDETHCWYGLHGSEGVAAFPDPPQRAHVDFNYLPEMMLCTNGIIRESEYPWTNISCGPPQTLDPVCSHFDKERFRFQKWGRVDVFDLDTVQARRVIKQALRDHGPLIACVLNDDRFKGYVENDGDPTTMARSKDNPVVHRYDTHSDMAHAVCIVGWGYVESTGTHYWILHNSITSWGNGGVGRALYNTAGIMYEVAYLDYNPPAIIGSNFASEVQVLQNHEKGTESIMDYPTKWGYKTFNWKLDHPGISVTKFENYPINNTDWESIYYTLNDTTIVGRFCNLKCIIQYEGISGCYDTQNYDTIQKSVWVGKPVPPQITGSPLMYCFTPELYSISNSDCLETSNTYEWVITGDLNIIGSNTGPSCLISSSGGPGTIQVKAFNLDGHSNSNVIYTVMLNCPLMSLSIYPNPANEQISVNVSTDTEVGDTFDYELIDDRGGQRKKVKDGGLNIYWSTSDLPEGTYYIRVKHKDKGQKQKDRKTEQLIIAR